MDTLPQPASTKDMLKVILVLAIPAVIDHFFQTIIGFVDTLFISKIGINEVTAVGISNAILQVYFAVFLSIGVAANVYIARFSGGKNTQSRQEYTYQLVILSSFIGLIFGILTLFFSSPMLQLLGAESEVLHLAKSYFQIVAIPSIFISLMFVLSSIHRGLGDTKTPMKVSIGINLLHIVLDYILIFGLFFIPPLGLIGAAYATVIARLIGALLLFIMLYKKDKSLTFYRLKVWTPNIVIQRQLLSLSGPAAGERLVMRIGQVLYFGLIVQLGTNTFAAHHIAGNIEVFSYMIGYGFAAAATTLVGQQLGANNYVMAKKYGLLTTYLSIGVMSIIGIFLFFSGELLGSLFTADKDVIHQISIALKVDAFIQPILAAVLVLTGIYQGGGNTKFPLYTTAIGIWLIRTLGVYVLGIQLNMGIAGIWIAIGLDNLFRCVWLWYKFEKDNWLRKMDRKSFEKNTST